MYRSVIMILVFLTFMFPGPLPPKRRRVCRFLYIAHDPSGSTRSPRRRFGTKKAPSTRSITRSGGSTTSRTFTTISTDFIFMPRSSNPFPPSSLSPPSSAPPGAGSYSYPFTIAAASSSPPTTSFSHASSGAWPKFYVIDFYIHDMKYKTKKQ